MKKIYNKPIIHCTAIKVQELLANSTQVTLYIDDGDTYEDAFHSKSMNIWSTED